MYVLRVFLWSFYRKKYCNVSAYNHGWQLLMHHLAIGYVRLDSPNVLITKSRVPTFFVFLASEPKRTLFSLENGKNFNSLYFVFECPTTVIH